MIASYLDSNEFLIVLDSHAMLLLSERYQDSDASIMYLDTHFGKKICSAPLLKNRRHVTTTEDRVDASPSAIPEEAMICFSAVIRHPISDASPQAV